MFETSLETPGGSLASRRAGRIAFGGVLIAGAVAMVRDVGAFGDGPRIGALWIMLGSWFLAFVAGFVVSQLRITRQLRTASIVVPSIGIALMLPLLLHLPFVLPTGAKAYNTWVALSLFAVGFAHVMFALLAALRAWQLSTGRRAISVWMVYVLVIIASGIPLGMFFLPPLITAITGLPVIGLLHHQETLANREREADRLGEIPAAIARWRALV
jgi:hypothetical protein